MMTTGDRIHYDCSVGIPYGDFDGKITASSEYSANHSVRGCKLGQGAPVNGHAVAWCAKSKAEDPCPWIQVDFGIPLLLSAVSTQGREGCNQYVKKFRVLVSQDGVNFVNTWEFAGNTNNTGIVKNRFPVPVQARVARIQILDYQEHPSLRFDFHHIPPPYQSLK